MANKGVKIFLIVVLVIIAIILINFMVVKIAKKDCKISFFSFGNKTEKIFENEYEINGINNINVTASSANVKFVEGKQDKIKVTAYGAKDESIEAKIEGENLEINKDKNVVHIFMFFCWYKEEIIVEIPKDFYGNVNTNVTSGNIESITLKNANLYLNSSSGNIKCEDMKNGEIKTSSGNIYAGSGNEVNLEASSGNIRAGYIVNGTINTSSGNIKLEELETGEIKASSGSISIEKIGNGTVKTTSGGINIGIIEIGEVKASSGNIKIGTANKITGALTSGNISINSIEEFCNLSAKSGMVKIENISLCENSSIKTTSGGVRISNASDMYINSKTKSGSVSVNNNDRKADVELKIETTSGSIKVDKLNEL